jgi:hypothetical protein
MKTAISEWCGLTFFAVLLLSACNQEQSAPDSSPLEAPDSISSDVLGDKSLEKASQALPPPSQRAIRVEGGEPVFPKPSDERIKEIAAMLPDEPGTLVPPAKNRAFWESAAELPGAEEFVASARDMALQPTPVLTPELYAEFARSGERISFEQPYKDRSERLGTFVLAECLTNDGSFLEVIERELVAILSEEKWLLPAHQISDPIDLGAATRAWTVALTAQLLHGKLNPELESRIGTELNRRIFAPYLAVVESGDPNTYRLGWMTTEMNWNAVCHAGVIGAALSNIRSKDERARMLAAAEIYLPFFLRPFEVDGYLDEGISYLNYGMGYFVYLAEFVFQQTGGRLNWFLNEEVGLAADYAVQFEIAGGVYPPFSDASITARAEPWIIDIIRMRRGEAFAPIEMDWKVKGVLGGELFRPISLLSVIYRKPDGLEMLGERDPLEIRSWFPKGRALVLRPGGDHLSGMAVAIKGAHNGENHNQNDEGTFVVVVDGKLVLTDLGAAHYNRDNFGRNRYNNPINTSWAHNVPLVAGAMQRTGRDAEVVTVELDFSEERDVWVQDLSSLYDVPALRRLTRTFIYHRNKQGMLEIIDEVEFDSPQEFGAAVIAAAGWKRTGENEWQVPWNGAAVDIEVSSPNGLILVEEAVKGGLRWKLTPTRLSYDIKEPSTQATIRTIIRPVAKKVAIP